MSPSDAIGQPLAVILGASGRAMLEALVAGTSDPAPPRRSRSSPSTSTSGGPAELARVPARRCRGERRPAPRERHVGQPAPRPRSRRLRLWMTSRTVSGSVNTTSLMRGRAHPLGREQDDLGPAPGDHRAARAPHHPQEAVALVVGDLPKPHARRRGGLPIADRSGSPLLRRRLPTLPEPGKPLPGTALAASLSARLDRGIDLAGRLAGRLAQGLA
jgi:hypothetical protein